MLLPAACRRHQCNGLFLRDPFLHKAKNRFRRFAQVHRQAFLGLPSVSWNLSPPLTSNFYAYPKRRAYVATQDRSTQYRHRHPARACRPGNPGAGHVSSLRSEIHPNPIAHACGQGHTGQRFPCVPQDAGKCVPPKVNVETTPHRRWTTIRHLQDLGAVVESAESSSSEVTATDKE